MRLILAITVLFVGSCKQHNNSSDNASPFRDTAKRFKKEIPTYPNGSVDLFYQLAKTKQNQLGLDSIENGFDDLQIRVWYDFSLVRERKLLLMTNKNGDWTATVYYLDVDWDGKTETILSKEIRHCTPKSGWAAFSKKLLDLQIISLPNQRDVKGYGGGFDGTTYNVEVATKDRYRFYGYWEPQHYQDKFWQAKNMSEILNLIETELGV